MIDALLVADAERWNAEQPTPPDLDAALGGLDIGRAGPAKTSYVVGAVAAVAAAVVAAVVIGSGGHHVARVESAVTPRPTVTVTSTVIAHLPQVTVTRRVVKTVVRRVVGTRFETQVNHVNATAILNVNITNTVNRTVLATKQITRPVNVTNSAVVTVTHQQTGTTLQPVQVQVAAKGNAGQSRVWIGGLVGAVGALLLCAGGWGIARTRAGRRAH